MMKQTELETKVGIFVVAGLTLIMGAILILGSTENFLSTKITYHTHFPNVDGLISGAKVVIGGIQVGKVERIVFDMDTRDIRVELSVSKDSSKWIRKNSTLEIATQGVLGDKYISITPGDTDQPEFEPNSELPNRPTSNLTQFISKGDQLLVNLNNLAISIDRLLKTFETANRSEVFFQSLTNTAKNLSSTSEKLNREVEDLKLKRISQSLESILEKVNNGNGTLGALINDPSLYDDAKKLVGEVNRNRIIRNLVRKTLKDAEAVENKSEKREP